MPVLLLFLGSVYLSLCQSVCQTMVLCAVCVVGPPTHPFTRRPALIATTRSLAPCAVSFFLSLILNVHFHCVMVFFPFAMQAMETQKEMSTIALSFQEKLAVIHRNYISCVHAHARSPPPTHTPAMVHRNSHTHTPTHPHTGPTSSLSPSHSRHDIDMLNIYKQLYRRLLRLPQASLVLVQVPHQLPVLLVPTTSPSSGKRYHFRTLQCLLSLSLSLYLYMGVQYIECEPVSVVI